MIASMEVVIMTKTQNLTKGNTTHIILRFFFPMLLTNLLQQIYSFADTAIVGKGIGDNALAAVGNMSSLTFLILGFSLGMANGFSVVISQYYGAGDHSAMRKAVGNAVGLSLWIAVILTVFSTVFLQPIMLLMKTPEVILKESLTYGYIMFGGLAVTVAYNLCSGILRSIGDSKTPFYAILISAMTNIILDCVLIIGCRTGVAGAAAATVFSQGISALICFVRIRNIDVLRLSCRDMLIDKVIFGELLKNGLPMACMNSITAVGCIAVQFFVNRLGVAYTSAYSACSKYLNLFLMPGMTIGWAMSGFASQNHGAGKIERIREGLHVCLRIGVIAYLLLGAVMVLFPRFLARLTLSGEEPIRFVVQFLPVCGVMLIAVNFLFVYRSCVQGMGQPLVPMLSGILEMFLRMMTIVILMPEIGFLSTAFAEVLAWSGAFIVNRIAYGSVMQKAGGRNALYHAEMRQEKQTIVQH